MVLTWVYFKLYKMRVGIYSEAHWGLDFILARRNIPV